MEDRLIFINYYKNIIVTGEADNLGIVRPITHINYANDIYKKIVGEGEDREEDQLICNLTVEGDEYTLRVSRFDSKQFVEGKQGSIDILNEQSGKITDEFYKMLFTEEVR